MSKALKTMTPAEYKNLPHLTHQQSRNLEVGTDLVCVDQDVYTSLITLGKIYTITGHDGTGDALIECNEGSFDLCCDDARLFAVVPGQQSGQTGLPAEALQELLNYIEGRLNEETESEHGEGYDAACLDILEFIGYTTEQSGIKVVRIV